VMGFVLSNEPLFLVDSQSDYNISNK